MIYFFIFLLLFIAEIFYFKIADKYNIIDKPNERSSHTEITLRGGGIIFYIGLAFFHFYSGFEYLWFFFGLTFIAIISFLDDIFSISNKIRILIHVISVSLMFFELGLFHYSWWILFVAFILVIGTINAYNFMDGINGLTAAYSFAILLLLYLANLRWSYIDMDVIYFCLIATGIFSFFNFRNKAKCFAGDIGSVTMAFILIFLTIALILKTGNFIYILFFVVYGVDSIWTIFQRVLRKENIFKAHRTHLYQYLSNEAGKNKLLISGLYGLTQCILGLMVIEVSMLRTEIQVFFSVVLIILISAIYLILKTVLIRKFTRNKNLIL